MHYGYHGNNPMHTLWALWPRLFGNISKYICILGIFAMFQIKGIRIFLAIFQTRGNMGIFGGKIEASYAESLAAPKIGAVLRFRDKWQKCPNLAPIFTIWGGKIGAPLWNDFEWQKCPELAPIFTIWGGEIRSPSWIDFAWQKCTDLAPIFTI